MKRETIAAPATGMSGSGIGIIRVSGEDAVEIVGRIFPGIKGMESHTIRYGFVFDEGKKVDEVMVSLMKGPRSYTREDVAEINCHGGLLVMNWVLELVLKNGARLAEPGEFTRRAFLNGRIDLAEAEAVMDLIRSRNEFAMKSSLRQLTGGVSDRIRGLREDILYEVAYIESALDDPEHIDLDGYGKILQGKVADLLARMEWLLKSSANGRILKEGIETVIVGKPNVGKSSLLNLLTGEERAIVTDIAGTTRDTLEESVKLDGIMLNMVDTAGIRSTQDVIERIGVERTRKYAQDANLIIYIVDSSVALDDNDREIINLISGKKIIVLLNKTDLAVQVDEEEILGLFDREWGCFDGYECTGNSKVKAEISWTIDVDRCYSEGVDKNDEVEKEDNGCPQVDKCGDKSFAGRYFDDKSRDESFSNRSFRDLIVIKTSTKENIGFDLFSQAVKEMFLTGEINPEEEIYITSMRHQEALQNAYESILQVKKSLDDKMPEDFYTIDLMSAYESLGLIIGEQVREDLVNEIFAKFCMGK